MAACCVHRTFLAYDSPDYHHPENFAALQFLNRALQRADRMVPARRLTRRIAPACSISDLLEKFLHSATRGRAGTRGSAGGSLINTPPPTGPTRRGPTRRETSMRDLKLHVAAAAVAATMFAPGSASALVFAGSSSMRGTIDAIGSVERAQYVVGGYRYCWYDDGWRGPGWYRCGFSARYGFGWGGPFGWHGLRGGHRFGGRTFEGRTFEGRRGEGRTFEGRGEGRTFEGRRGEGRTFEGRSSQGEVGR